MERHLVAFAVTVCSCSYLIFELASLSILLYVRLPWFECMCIWVWMTQWSCSCMSSHFFLVKSWMSQGGLMFSTRPSEYVFHAWLNPEVNHHSWTLLSWNVQYQCTGVFLSTHALWASKVEVYCTWFLKLFHNSFHLRWFDSCRTFGLINATKD